MATPPPVSDTVSSSAIQIKTEPYEVPVYYYPHDVERIKSEEDDQSLVYADREVKKEMVIGPIEVQDPVSAELVQKQETVAVCSMDAVKTEQWYIYRKPNPKLAGKTPFSCDQCGKGFAIKKYLKQHSRVHSKEKYLCRHCNKQLSNKYTLVTHLRLHGGKKPFFCDHCDKWFSHKTNMDRHRRLHFGEEPFCSTLASKILKTWEYPDS